MLGVNASGATNGSAKVRKKRPPATTSPRSDNKFRMDQLRRGLSSFWRKKIPPMVTKNSRGGCVADLILVSTKKVYRLCRAREMLWPQRQPKPLPPRRLPRNGVTIRPNPLWQIDLKYGDLVGDDRFFSWQAVNDV